MLAQRSQAYLLCLLASIPSAWLHVRAGFVLVRLVFESHTANRNMSGRLGGLKHWNRPQRSLAKPNRLASLFSQSGAGAASQQAPWEFAAGAVSTSWESVQGGTCGSVGAREWSSPNRTREGHEEVRGYVLHANWEWQWLTVKVPGERLHLLGCLWSFWSKSLHVCFLDRNEQSSMWLCD